MLQKMLSFLKKVLFCEYHLVKAFVWKSLLIYHFFKAFSLAGLLEEIITEIQGLL